MNLVIFDLDNTLLKGDSDYNWALFLIKKGLIDKSLYEQKNEQFYKDYQNGSLDVFEYCEFQFEVLKNNKRKTLEQLREQYLQEVILPMIPEKAYDLVKKHKKNKEKLLIITATNSFITKPIGKIIGINNRNLETFDVDLQTSSDLIPKIPKDKIIVAESGITSHDDIKRYKDLGANAVLIGETFMREQDIGKKIDELMMGV